MTERFNAIVGADIKEFQRKMNEVDREIRQLASGVDVDLELAAEEFYAEAQAVKKELRGLDGKEARMQIDLAYQEFMRDLYKVYTMAETMDDYDIDVEVDAIIGEFQKKILLAKALAQGLSADDINIDVDLHTRQFYKSLARISLAMSRLEAKRVVIGFQANYTEFQNTMGRVASQMRTWGEIFGTMFTGAMISMIPTLSPIISTLIGLIGSLGVMIGVLGGQMLILASSVGIAATGFVGLAAVAIPTIKKLFDETAKLTAEQQRARDAWDSFVDVYDELVAKTEGAVLQGFTSAMQGAQKILQSLEPMIIGVADAAARLADAFSQSIDTGPVQRIFEAFNEYGPEIFENFTSAIGLFVQGIFSMIAALAPAAAVWTENFNGMMESFAAWADGLSESEKFQEFIAYVQEYMPVISQLFGNLTVGIVEFFSAFGDMAGDFMTSLADMMERFREWASTLGENNEFQTFLNYIRESTPAVLELIKQLWDFLVNLGIAMAPFGAIVLDLTNKFLGWMNSMMETHGWFSNIIGAIPTLIGGFMLLMAPIVMFTTIFGKTLVSAISLAIKAFGSIGGAVARVAPYFMTIIDDVGRVIGVVTNLASKALPWLVRGFGLLTGPIGVAIAIITTLITIGIALYKNWDTIRSYASSIWASISNIFSTTVSAIVGWVSNGFTSLYNSVVSSMQLVVSNIQTKWGEARSFLEGINLATIGKNIVQGLVNGISSGFGWVKEKVAQLANLVPEWLRGPLGIKSPSRVMAAVAKWIPAGVAKGILDNVNLVKQASKKMADAVTLDFSVNTNKMSSAYKSLLNVVKETAKANERATKETTKVNGKTITTFIKKTNAERYEAFESSLSDHKKFNNVSAQYERQYWLDAAKHLKNGTAARRKALENANAAEAQMQQEKFQKEMNFIDQAREYGVLSLRDQIRAYQDYMKQYKVGSDEQIAYEEALYKTKQKLYEDLKTVASNYATEVKAVYDKLADEEQRLRDEYQKTFESRRDTLANSWGLFDQPTLADTSELDIVGNMRQQVNTLSNWMNDIFRLQSFGLNEALMTELQNLGPKAAAEISALANLSSQELGEYEMLWKAKMELAGKQATNELAGARADMEAEIVKLRENAVKDLEKLKNDMLTEVNEMVNGSKDSFDVLKHTLPEIGKKAMEGLINSFKTMGGTLKATIQGISNDVSREMTNILSGKGFNATTNVTPAVTSTSSMKVNSSSYNNVELERPIVNLNLNSTFTGAEVKYWLDEQDANETRINMRK